MFKNKRKTKNGKIPKELLKDNSRGKVPKEKRREGSGAIPSIPELFWACGSAKVFQYSIG